jgi:hypothetical protein
MQALTSQLTPAASAALGANANIRLKNVSAEKTDTEKRDMAGPPMEN